MDGNEAEDGVAFWYLILLKILGGKERDTLFIAATQVGTILSTVCS